MKQHKAIPIFAIAAWAGLAAWAAATVRGAENALAKLGLPSAGEKLVQQIDCAAENRDVLFVEFPPGVSKVETVLGRRCRVLSNAAGDAKYFAYRLGEGKGLKAGRCYVVSLEYPEDRPRTMYLCNWGCETALGFATGESLGDVWKGKYVAHNPESIKYPLSGKFQRWTHLFYLHDRFPEIKRPRGLGPRPLTPEDGFWFIVAQPAAFQDPLGAGAAVSTIRLYEIPNPEAWTQALRFPPEGLPRRHVFSREEMADGVVVPGHKPEEKDPALRGVTDIAAWYEYKMRVMRFLGIDTYGKDLLEFGHNQGWDSAPGGGSDWVNQSPTPWLWAEIVRRAAALRLGILPYYEYRGSIGGNKSLALGPQHRCRRLDGGDTYRHIGWCEGNNADITDPDTLADACKILDLSLLKYQDQAQFLGAWFRQRPTAMPISFNDKNLGAFSTEANGGRRITRSHLQADARLLARYYDWWFGRRRRFFEGLRDHLRTGLGQAAFVLYTNDSSEPGRPLPRSITGNTNHRGFPRYVRRFHAAFLALPALPSAVMPDATADPEVVVRSIRTEKHGVYLAVVNTGFQAKPRVELSAPGAVVHDAATGEPLAISGGKLTLALDPAELRALHAP